MVGRRSFLAYGIGMMATPVVAQKAIMEGKNAVVCDEDSTVCPNGHKTCKVINKPIAIGNDRQDYPEVNQLFDFKLFRCDVCKVLFTDK